MEKNIKVRFTKSQVFVPFLAHLFNRKFVVRSMNEIRLQNIIKVINCLNYRFGLENSIYCLELINSMTLQVKIKAYMKVPDSN